MVSSFCRFEFCWANVFLTALTMFNIGNTITLYSAEIQCCINSIGPCYFTVAPLWSKSYHDTGPQGTFLCHLVCHRTLSKILIWVTTKAKLSPLFTHCNNTFSCILLQKELIMSPIISSKLSNCLPPLQSLGTLFTLTKIFQTMFNILMLLAMLVVLNICDFVVEYKVKFLK